MEINQKEIVDKEKGRSNQGNRIVLIVIFILLPILMLMLMQIPMFLKARDRSRDAICIKNMKEIIQAISQVSEQSKLYISRGIIVWEEAPSSKGFGVVGEDGYFKETPVCPIGGYYTAVGEADGTIQMTCSGINHNTYAMYNYPNGPGGANNRAFVLQ